MVKAPSLREKGNKLLRMPVFKVIPVWNELLRVGFDLIN
jgi:hypothetical protein